MKKLFYTLTLLVGFSTVAFSQEKADIANTEGKTELAKSKVSGEYTFELPSHVTSEQVKKNASYYTSLFSVGFDKDSHKATVSMIDNTSKSRYVVARFLTACGVRFVEIDGKNVALYDFIDDHLK